MSKFTSLFLSLFLMTSLFAQRPAGMGGAQSERKGHVFGKIVDEKGVPVPMANVLVLQNRYDSTLATNKDFVIKSTASENNGEFSIEDIPVTKGLKLKVAFFGYVTTELNFSFDLATATGGIIEKDFGKIVFKEEVIDELEEVQVTAMQSTLRLDVDKKVFNVGQNAMSDGGTALDVMKNVPGVDVDIDGNVNLRNNTPQIFLDGRPTTLTLDQIPAESIESVEIITNPSSKYDASGGGGGILNIVLKKNKKTGYNGGVRAGVDSYLGGNLGVDFNLRQNKVNFTGSLNGRLNNGKTFGDVDRTNLLNGATLTNITQKNTDKRTGGGFFGKLGVDYMLTNRTTLSLAGNLWAGSFNNTSDLDILTDSVAAGGTSPYYSQRLTDSKRNMANYGINFGMKHLFQKPGEEWTFDATFNNGNGKSNSLYESDYHILGEDSEISRSTYQKIKGAGNETNLVLQTDYVRPFKYFKLETGLRAAMRNRKNINDNFLFNGTDYQLVYNPASNYNNKDNVYAAYGTISNQIKGFGYKVGLRAESSDYKGELTTTGEKFGNTYPISLFPSLFLTQTLKKDQDLQFSYTRRINRPNFRQLIPFVDSVDMFNISRGNPNLRPEFIQAIELQYMKRFKNRNSVLASVYYKYTNNLITRYIEQADNGALINTYINANSSYSGGLELTSQNYIAKWWEINTNVNIYNSRINSGSEVSASQAALWSWFGKLNMNFKLPKSYSIQLSGMYQSKTNVPVNSGGGGPMGGMNQAQSASQGYVKAFYAVDLAVKKSFYNNRMSLTLSFSDIFRTRYNVSYTQSEYFVQNYSRISNPQMVRLNFSYNFGKVDAVLFKRVSKGTGEDITQ